VGDYDDRPPFNSTVSRRRETLPEPFGLEAVECWMISLPEFTW
jgi:hypothetical protein